MSATVNHPLLRGFRTQAAALCGVLLLAFTGQANAIGTDSGTTISNRATLTYSVGGVSQSAIGSSPTGNTSGAGSDTSFVVDNKVSVLVTESNSTYTTVAPGASAQVTTFSVTNLGNTVQDFALAAANLASGTSLFTLSDSFDATACTAYRESGANAGYLAAEDTATYVDELSATSGSNSVTVYVVCNIPAGQANDSYAVVSLTATARAGGAAASLGAALTETAGANTAGVDIVFADAAGTDDASRDAASSARDAFRVVSSALTVTKTVALVCDPLNANSNPKNIPGAVVRWTITVANAAGAGSATLTQVTDALNANSTFDPDLVVASATPANCEGASGGAGTPESANGSGFKLDVTGDTRPGTYPKFFTTANDGDGADLNGTTVEIDYGPAMPAEGTYAAGELKAGESVVVYFNVSIN